MSDDLDKKIRQITDLLGQESMPDNIKGLLSLLTSSAQKNEGSSGQTEDPPPFREEKHEKNDMEMNLELMRKVKKVMDKMNSSHDPRVNLLNAIRPFLNSSRQKKVANCIRLLQMSSMARYLDDKDIK